MLTYANSFSCSVNQNKTEYILTMRQISPEIGEDGKLSKLKAETISQFALNAEGAASLCALLSAVINSDSGDNT